MRSVCAAFLLLLIACARPFPVSSREQNLAAGLLAWLGLSSGALPAYSGAKSVDTAGNVGTSASIAVSRCVIYIAHLDNGSSLVRLACSWDGGNSFTLSTIGSNGAAPSIVVDGDNVHVPYFLTAGGDPVLARSTDGGQSFTQTTLDSVGNVGNFSSVALAGSNVYIAYYDTTHIDLKVARSTDYGVTFANSRAVLARTRPCRPMRAASMSVTTTPGAWI